MLGFLVYVKLDMKLPMGKVVGLGMRHRKRTRKTERDNKGELSFGGFSGGLRVRSVPREKLITSL